MPLPEAISSKCEGLRALGHGTIQAPFIPLPCLVVVPDVMKDSSDRRALLGLKQQGSVEEATTQFKQVGSGRI